MRRSWVLWGALLLSSACGDDEKEPSDEVDSGIEDEETDAGDPGTPGDEDAGGNGCVEHNEDAVTDPGKSCNAGPSACIHYIGTGWTDGDVQADCTESGALAMGMGCVNTGFCARTTTVTCRVQDGADKVRYIYGLPDGICALLMGVELQKPAEGWPNSYENFVPPAGDAGT